MWSSALVGLRHRARRALATPIRLRGRRRRAAPLLRCHSQHAAAPADGRGTKSFIEHVRDEGDANALLGPLVHRGGFDRCLAGTAAATGDPSAAGGGDGDGDGLVVSRQEPGVVEASFVVAPHMQNAFGTLHGGATSTVVDVLGTMALLTRDPARPGVTVELSTSFLNGARVGDTLDVRGTVTKYGRRLGFTEVELRSRTTGKVVATGRHTKFFA